MPGKNKLLLGLQQYSLFKRYQEHEAGKLRSAQEFFLISYGIADWFSLDLKGGYGNIKQRPAESPEVDYPSYLGGGYGFRLRLFKERKIRAVFGFQHISIHPFRVNLGGVNHKAVLDDWQVSLLTSYNFKTITPYLGARWSRLGCIHWVDKQRDLVKSDLTKEIGLIIGADFNLAENFWLNLEGSFFDSSALAFSLNYSF